MKINVKSKGTQPTCQMPFVLSCEHWFYNEKRYQIKLKGLPPLEFRKQVS